MKVRFAVSVGLGAPEPEGLGDALRAVEERGFDSVWMSDVPSAAAVDPGLGVAYAAACTDRLHLGINLIPFGSAPFSVAHRMAQLDRLSAGRLLITLVAGLENQAERSALGTAGRHRGKMMDELVPKLRAWWAGDRVDVGDGTELALPVRPVQDPLELWLGGSGPDAVVRAGRLADGWLGALVPPGRAGKVVAAIQDEAARLGRVVDPEHFGLSVGYARSTAEAERAGESVRARMRRGAQPAAGEVPPERSELVPSGTAELRRLIERLVDDGLSKFVLRPVSPVTCWDGELDWLASSVLDLQT